MDMRPLPALLQPLPSRPQHPTHSFCGPPEGTKPQQTRWGHGKTHAWREAPAQAANYLCGPEQVTLPLGLFPSLHSGDNNPAWPACER